MEAKKIMIVAIFCLLGVTAIAQKDTVFKKGMIRAHGNIASGYLFQSNKFAPYITGNMEYYINEGFSLVGEAWCSFDIAANNEIGLRKNYAVFGGLNYHPVRFSRWDPYIGFSAGLSLITTNHFVDTLIRESPAQFAPIVGVTAGLNYYIGSIFHFFFQCKFVAGGSNSSQYGRTYLEELKLSGGLGWNFTPRKKYKKKK